nr:FxsB family radical SAM/SPASM domain protein [Streptomyces sp. DSM 41633]
MTGPLVPFREFVLKVHSRCDLACDHCYVYEHADQSWRTRPKTISDEAVSWTARRLAEQAATHALPSVAVILHGGEPLLAGPARLRRVCEELGSALD